jgi:hypothetical protein
VLFCARRVEAWGNITKLHTTGNEGGMLMTSRAHSLGDVTGDKLPSHAEEMRFVTGGLCCLTKHICSTKSAIPIHDTTNASGLSCVSCVLVLMGWLQKTKWGIRRRTPWWWASPCEKAAVSNWHGGGLNHGFGWVRLPVKTVLRLWSESSTAAPAGVVTLLEVLICSSHLPFQHALGENLDLVF